MAKKNLKMRVFSSMFKACRESKETWNLQQKEKEHEAEIDEITNRYNKEMNLLREQLAETQSNLN